jgi:hypothetical protein
MDHRIWPSAMYSCMLAKCFWELYTVKVVYLRRTYEKLCLYFLSMAKSLPVASISYK